MNLTGRFGVIDRTTNTIYLHWLTSNHAALWASQNLKNSEWIVYVIKTINEVN